MEIILIHRNIFQNRPPLVSLVKTLLAYNIRPIIITAGLNNEFKSYFNSNKITFHVVPFELTRTRFSPVKNYLRSLLWGKKVAKILNNYSPVDHLLWIEGNYTFTSLQASLINRYKHVLQIQEMFNVPGIKGKLYERTISRIINKAEAVIVPEYNRAYLYKLQFKLKKLPYILPNKPSFVPNSDDLVRLKSKYTEYEYLFNKKVILYQGVISSTRSNYMPILDALVKYDKGQEYIFVFLGREESLGYVNNLKQNGYPVEHVPFIPAPDYLYFTSRAYIGIVNYADNCLNNIYCAPNKIYEYSVFGVPMIANDIPGLRYTIGTNRCGCLYEDENQIETALISVIRNHDEMSTNAINFYRTTEYSSIVEQIINDLDL